MKNKPLNEALRLLRVFHDLKQSVVAEQLSISKSHLSEIESGGKSPSIELLKKYSDHFNIPVSSLMLFSENLENGTVTSNRQLRAARKIVRLMDWIAAKSDMDDEEEAIA